VPCILCGVGDLGFPWSLPGARKLYPSCEDLLRLSSFEESQNEEEDRSKHRLGDRVHTAGLDVSPKFLGFLLGRKMM